MLKSKESVQEDIHPDTDHDEWRCSTKSDLIPPSLQQTPSPTVNFHLPDFVEEEQSDENVTKSNDEYVERGKTLKGILPIPPSTSSPAQPTLSTSTTLHSLSSTQIHSVNVQYLLQLNTEIQPNAEHIVTVKEGVKAFLQVLLHKDPLEELSPSPITQLAPLIPSCLLQNCDFHILPQG